MSAAWVEPSEPFDFDAVDAALANARAVPAAASADQLRLTGALEMLRQFVRKPSDLRAPRAIGRKVAVYAFRAGLLGDMTQQTLGEWLGYPKRSARQCCNALIRREEIAQRLSAAGPGRNARKNPRR